MLPIDIARSRRLLSDFLGIMKSTSAAGITQGLTSSISFIPVSFASFNSDKLRFFLQILRLLFLCCIIRYSPGFYLYFSSCGLPPFRKLNVYCYSVQAFKDIRDEEFSWLLCESVCHVIPLKLPNIANCGNLTECHFCVSYRSPKQNFLSTNCVNESIEERRWLIAVLSAAKLKDTTTDLSWLSESMFRNCACGCFYPWLLTRQRLHQSHYRFKTTFRGLLVRFIHRLPFHRFLLVARYYAISVSVTRKMSSGLTRILWRWIRLTNSFRPSVYSAHFKGFESDAKDFSISWVVVFFRTSLPKIAMWASFEVD